MLRSAGKSDREIEFRRDDRAGLADLMIVADEIRVDRGPGRADGRVQVTGERFEQRAKLCGRAEAASAGDDDSGGRERRVFRIGPGGAEPA